MAQYTFRIQGPGLLLDDVEVDLQDQRQVWSEAVRTAAAAIYDLDPPGKEGVSPPLSLTIIDDSGKPLWLMQFQADRLTD